MKLSMLGKLFRTPAGTPAETTASRRHANRNQVGERGQIFVVVALSAIVLFGIVGIAIDVGRLYVARAELSRAVDAAALAGVVELPNLDTASSQALAYLLANEPNAVPNIDPDAANNALSVDASKTVGFYFIKVLGIDSATVSAHAKAGFGVAYSDTALVIDATASMAGTDIANAKAAAIQFKDTLLGSSPNGRTVVGVTPFRGCFNPNLNKSDCINVSTQVTEMTSDSALLTSRINAIASGVASATNVCTGVARGWSILQGPLNHNAEDNATHYLVLLSDGDNYYLGNYTWQDSPRTPAGATIDGVDYPCAPPVSCNEPGYAVGESTGSDPCISQVYVSAYDVASDNFDGPSYSCPSSWNSGSGWASDWIPDGSPSPDLTTGSSPYDTSCHLHMVGTDTAICRAVDLTGLSAADLEYRAKNSSWESGDGVYLEISTNSCSSGFSQLNDHTGGNTSGSYSLYSESLDSYADQVVYIRFRGHMSSTSADHFYLDAVAVSAGSSGSQDGYVNGSDTSSPTNCNVAPKRRERQLDLETYYLAEAIKAHDVEIFVVAFGACNGDSSAIYTDAQCDAQVGNTDSETVGNQRLLKCMASSKAGGNDHYFWAASSSELPSIFTQIARQIAHRLIE